MHVCREKPEKGHDGPNLGVDCVSSNEVKNSLEYS